MNEPVTYKIFDWDGSNWNPLNNGINGKINTIVFDSNANLIYVGGYFSEIDSINGTSNIVSWDGIKWNALENGTNDEVVALAFDVNSNYLYVGGYFSQAGSLNPNQSNLIAIWNKTTWQSIGNGLSNFAIFEQRNYINSFAFGAQANTLFVGGQFGPNHPHFLVYWNGQNWTFIEQNYCIEFNAIILQCSVSSMVFDINTNQLYFSGQITNSSELLYGGGSLISFGNIQFENSTNIETTNYTLFNNSNIFGLGAISTIFYDRTTNLFYFGGSFAKIGSIVMNSITIFGNITNSTTTTTQTPTPTNSNNSNGQVQASLTNSTNSIVIIVVVVVIIVILVSFF